MIEVRSLIKSFDDFVALDRVDMTVPKAAVYGLVGPNGSGKSTLIRHLSGAYRPDSGSVQVDRHEIWENEELKRRIVTVPDEPFYFSGASTRDMAQFYAGFYPSFNWDRYRTLSEVFPEVSDRNLIRKLSKGLQKQSAFWIALCCSPDLLLLDEPVDGLDPLMRRQIWRLILADVEERGMTVLISSHNLRELEDVCTHVGILLRGKMKLERDLADLQSGICKLQVVWPDGAEHIPSGLLPLHQNRSGRVQTLIFRTSPEEAQARYEAEDPLFCEALPLSLEEIFIYEIGGADHDVSEILL